VIEGFEFASSTSASYTCGPCNKPSGVEAGDLLVLIGMNDDSTNNPQFSDNKSGWNFVKNCGTTGSDSHVGVFWRIATGSEGSDESITMYDDEGWMLWYLRISGVDSSGTQEALGVCSTVMGGLYYQDMPEIQTTNADCLAMAFAAHDGGDGHPFTISGTGWTLGQSNNNSSSSTELSGCWAYKNMATAGWTADCRVTSQVKDGMIGFQVAFRGGEGGPPPGAYSGRGIGRGINRGVVR
jgi:hypothetical protein